MKKILFFKLFILNIFTYNKYHNCMFCNNFYKKQFNLKNLFCFHCYRCHSWQHYFINKSKPKNQANKLQCYTLIGLKYKIEYYPSINESVISEINKEYRGFGNPYFINERSYKINFKNINPKNIDETINKYLLLL